MDVRKQRFVWLYLNALTVHERVIMPIGMCTQIRGTRATIVDKPEPLTIIYDHTVTLFELGPDCICALEIASVATVNAFGNEIFNPRNVDRRHISGVALIHLRCHTKSRVVMDVGPPRHV